MAKSSYLSNSAKLLIVVSAILLVANALLTIGSFASDQSFIDLGSNLSNKALYIVLVIGFIAFNGEGVCYKRYRDRKSKKVTSYFKLHLFVCFLMNFIKGAFDMYAMSLTGTARTIACFVMSVISTVITYGFLLCAVSIWYIFRDSSHKKLLPLEALAFSFGLIYNVYKLFNYAVVKYEISGFGSMFTEFFSSNDALRILNILHLIFNILMLIQVASFYGKLGEKEQVELDRNVKILAPARNVYKDEGFGIDTLDDDYLLPDTIEE